MSPLATEPKRILITGAGRGLGRALAIEAARQGHDVAINYRFDTAAAEALAAQLSLGGGKVIALQADVTDARQVQDMVDAMVAQFGGLDCVVNNAGIGSVVDLDALDEATFEHVLRSNLTSAFLVSQAAWPHMKADGGRLVFVSSGAARSGGRLSAAYAASKAGMEGLMHYYATYLRAHRITANAIAPAMVESDMVRGMAPADTGSLPFGRLGRAAELWPALRMILDTEYLTGQTIHVDGGRYMT
ncbi:SDR family NAD(P)-dependent oxidoreductase [Variovorax sp. KK3]|uniref:SDR family NAD(P)-dependent oxidoreductase n=1 Tax=Variovorax sp. KK3 TaxID=1855728 RepID=UPI00097C14D8|nr:SDR family oxidoreductase [Variovorax sp. KK3]